MALEQANIATCIQYVQDQCSNPYLPRWEEAAWEPLGEDAAESREPPTQIISFRCFEVWGKVQRSRDPYFLEGRYGSWPTVKSYRMTNPA